MIKSLIKSKIQAKNKYNFKKVMSKSKIQHKDKE